MGGWVALLRGVNIGGHNKLPMAELRELAVQAGFPDARTYIASGNLVFSSDADEGAIREALERAIERKAGRKLGVIVRSAREMAGVAARNPFPDCPGNRVAAMFTDEPVSLEGVKHQADEELALGEREIFAHYPGGFGKSRLVIPAMKQGTARNMNTVARLAEMAREVDA